MPECPAAIVEKPIAVESEDWKQIAGLAEETKTKFVVNTQLNFHPQNLELKQDVSEGRIGELKFIDASARSTPVDQGPHVLQLVSSYIDNSRPVACTWADFWRRTSGFSTTLSTVCERARSSTKMDSTSLSHSVQPSHRLRPMTRSSFSINAFLS